MNCASTSIHDRQGHPYPAYVIVIDRGGLGEYYDVQGSLLDRPPLLSNPSQIVRIGSRTYSLYYAGEEIRTIAWREAGAAYWIQNTLTNSVQPGRCWRWPSRRCPSSARDNGAVAVASTAPTLRSVNLPPREAAATSLASKVERRARLRRPRCRRATGARPAPAPTRAEPPTRAVAHAIALEVRQRPLLATGAGAAGVLRSAGRPDPPPPALGSGAGDAAPTIYRVGRRWRTGVLAIGGVAIAGLVVAAALMHVL